MPGVGFVLEVLRNSLWPRLRQVQAAGVEQRAVDVGLLRMWVLASMKGDVVSDVTLGAGFSQKGVHMAPEAGGVPKAIQ